MKPSSPPTFWLWYLCVCVENRKKIRRSKKSSNHYHNNHYRFDEGKSFQNKNWHVTMVFLLPPPPPPSITKSRWLNSTLQWQIIKKRNETKEKYTCRVDKIFIWIAIGGRLWSESFRQFSCTPKKEIINYFFEFSGIPMDKWSIDGNFFFRRKKNKVTLLLF